jgi:hypothetical protein
MAAVAIAAVVAAEAAVVASSRIGDAPLHASDAEIDHAILLGASLGVAAIVIALLLVWILNRSGD